MTAQDILKNISALPETEKEALRALLRERPEILASVRDSKVETAHQEVMERYNKSFRELSR